MASSGLCSGVGLAEGRWQRSRGERGGSSGRMEQICIFLRAHPADRALCCQGLVLAARHRQIPSRPPLFFSARKKATFRVASAAPTPALNLSEVLLTQASFALPLSAEVL